MDGKTIARLRQDADVQQNSLAGSKGISTSTLIDIERNRIKLAQSEYKDLKGLISEIEAKRKAGQRDEAA